MAYPVPTHHIGNLYTTISHHPRCLPLGNPVIVTSRCYPQTESNIMTAVCPLSQSSGGEMLMELDFGRSLSSVHVFGHKGYMNEAVTYPPLQSLAIVHPKLPWPVIIQRSGNRKWATVADIVERLCSRNKDDGPLTAIEGCESTLKGTRRGTTSGRAVIVLKRQRMKSQWP
ncbi:hypothetical protein IW262DRAFT_1291160 [Armillaria fumosa]|nr:hypothetical protein IW262DRAFT_1291160 [Armillaria fumosa]